MGTAADAATPGRWAYNARLRRAVSPPLVHALVFGSAEDHGCPEPKVEVAEIFKSCYQALRCRAARPLRFNAAINTLAAT